MITIDLSNMEQSLLLAAEDLETFSLDPKQHFKATFVCEEILTNLARHAAFENRTPEVSLSLARSEKHALVLTFKDNAEFFDLRDFPDPKIGGELEETALGGLGIYLTKQYARNIRYTQGNGYNTLEIVL